MGHRRRSDAGGSLVPSAAGELPNLLTAVTTTAPKGSGLTHSWETSSEISLQSQPAAVSVSSVNAGLRN